MLGGRCGLVVCEETGQQMTSDGAWVAVMLATETKTVSGHLEMWATQTQRVWRRRQRDGLAWGPGPGWGTLLKAGWKLPVIDKCCCG